MGRQAIQDRDQQVVGYELLFRDRPDAPTADDTTVGGEQMTAEVVFGALNIGLTQLAEGRLIFCNATRSVLVGDLPITLPAEQTVIEVLESVVIDDEVLDGCRALVEQGYRLALDDFTWFDGADDLMKLASIVKIDVQTTAGDELADLVQRCHGYDVQLLAEKIETADELLRCEALGFELFQGYLLERPTIVSGRTLEASRASRLRMAAMLLSGELDFDDVLNLLQSDPAVAYQVTQLASVGRLGETRRQIATIHDAVLVAGSRRIQTWMSLILLRSGRSERQDRYTDMLVRARAVELLGQRIDRRTASIGFAAGLLSALDIVLGVPAGALRASLSLSPELADAAFGGDTALARIVRAAAAYQLGSPSVGAPDGTELDEAFAQAFVWALQTEAALAGD